MEISALHGKRMNLDVTKINATEGMKDQITTMINSKVQEVVKIEDVDDTIYIAE